MSHWPLWCFAIMIHRGTSRSKVWHQFAVSEITCAKRRMWVGTSTIIPIARDDVTHLVNVWLVRRRLFSLAYDDIIKWKQLPRYWPFVRGIHRSPVNSPQRPVTRSFDAFFDLRLNKRLSKQSCGWWFETPSGPLWRHSNENRSFNWTC